MDKLDEKVAAGESSRPRATKQEVLSAFMNGQLTGLFAHRRVSLSMAEEMLEQARTLLGAIPDDDPRIKPLVKFVENRTVGRRANKTVRYKAQRSTQRRTPYLGNLPLDIFGEDVEHVSAHFEVRRGKARIVIERCE